MKVKLRSLKNRQIVLRTIYLILIYQNIRIMGDTPGEHFYRVDKTAARLIATFIQYAKN